MNGIAGLLGSKKGSLVLIAAVLLFVSESGYLSQEPSPVVLYCGTALFGLAIVCQTVIDVVEIWRGKSNGGT